MAASVAAIVQLLSTSGIGRAIALQLARDGAEVIVHGRDAVGYFDGEPDAE